MQQQLRPCKQRWLKDVQWFTEKRYRVQLPCNQLSSDPLQGAPDVKCVFAPLLIPSALIIGGSLIRLSQA